MIPFPLPAAIKHLADNPDLRAIHGGRVATSLREAPCLRVTLMPGASGPEWQWSAHIQIEAWAKTDLEAGRLVSIARDVWPTLRGPYASNHGFISGTWIAVEPLYTYDEDADLHRYFFVGGISAHKLEATP